MPQLRRDRTAKKKLRKLFKETSATRTKRGAGEEERASSLTPYCLGRITFVKRLSHVTLLYVEITPKGCTVGNITQVTISVGSFPFGYDLNQFDRCLDLTVLEQNLYSICEKVDDEDFQKIILQKLNKVKLNCVDCDCQGIVDFFGSVESMDRFTHFAPSLRCSPLPFLTQTSGCLDQCPVWLQKQTSPSGTSPPWAP